MFVLSGHIAFIQMAFIRARVLQTFPVNLVCTSITPIFLILAGLYANRLTFLFTETNNICYFKFMLGTNISVFSFDVACAFPKNIFFIIDNDIQIFSVCLHQIVNTIFFPFVKWDCFLFYTKKKYILFVKLCFNKYIFLLIFTCHIIDKLCRRQLSFSFFLFLSFSSGFGKIAE